MQIRTGASGSLYFGLPVTSILNSVVTLTVDAGSLTLVQNVAPGKVVSAQVSHFPSLTLPCKIQHEPSQQNATREQIFRSKAPYQLGNDARTCSTYSHFQAIHIVHCCVTSLAAIPCSRALLSDDASL